MDVIRITTRLNVGGIARHVTWLTAGLAKEGYRTILVAGAVPPGEDDMTPFARAHGVEPRFMPEMSREISLKDVVTVWKLFRLFCAERPLLVCTHAAKAGAVGRAAGLLYRGYNALRPGGRARPCRFVHTYHGHIFHSYYGRLKTWLFLTVERTLARLATDRIVVISPKQFREIHEEYGVGRKDQFAVIRLGLDLGAYADWPRRRRELREELGAGDDLLVGIVGRLTEIKNHALFLDAAALFKKTAGGRRVRFLVVGDGHLREPLERQARARGLEGDVTFLGTRDDPEVFYPGLDVVALTSLNEGTPLTLIEAMANARAVIATDVGGVVDLVGAETISPHDGFSVRERGVLVRPRDAAAFARGLELLAGDDGLRDRLGRSGREFVNECYPVERLIRDFADLYVGLLGAEACRRATVLGGPGLVANEGGG